MLKWDHFKLPPVSVHFSSDDTDSIEQAAGSRS